MTAEQYARIRSQDPRYRGKSGIAITQYTTKCQYVIEFGHPGSSTLPRATTRSAEAETGGRNDKVAAATSSTSLYDNVAGGNQGTQLFSFAILK